MVMLLHIIIYTLRNKTKALLTKKPLQGRDRKWKTSFTLGRKDYQLPWCSTHFEIAMFNLKMGYIVKALLNLISEIVYNIHLLVAVCHVHVFYQLIYKSLTKPK